MSVSRAQGSKEGEDETHLVAVSSSGTSETGLGSLGALSAAENKGEDMRFLVEEGRETRRTKGGPPRCIGGRSWAWGAGHSLARRVRPGHTGSTWGFRPGGKLFKREGRTWTGQNSNARLQVRSEEGRTGSDVSA